MKFAALVGVLVALTSSASAQIITVRSSVIGTDGHLFSSDFIGAKVTETYILGSSTLRHIAPGFDFIEYTALGKLEAEGLGVLIDWSPSYFDIQDVPTGYGFISGVGTELWSSNPSVLTNQFLTTPVDVSLFDRMSTGGYAVVDRSGDRPQLVGYLFWKVTAVDVSNPSAVPEPSSYALAGSALLVGLIVARRKFKVRSELRS